jgi:hypothetical protein
MGHPPSPGRTLNVSTLTILELTISIRTMLQRNTGPAGSATALSRLRTLVLTDIVAPGGIGDTSLCEYALTSESWGE